MIRMPQRNVTRFIIPLIDVLILLFCIFLLMEFNTASKADEESEKVAEKSFEIDILESELFTRAKELQQFEELRPQLTEMAKMRDELEKLRAETQQVLKKRVYVRTIDYDGKDGSISFYDETSPDQPVYKITDAGSAKKLIERHKEEAAAKGRTLYYQFMLPRPYRFIFPNVNQKSQYAKWFKGTANSLEVTEK